MTRKYSTCNINPQCKWTIQNNTHNGNGESNTWAHQAQLSAHLPWCQGQTHISAPCTKPAVGALVHNALHQANLCRTQWHPLPHTLLHHTSLSEPCVFCIHQYPGIHSCLHHIRQVLAGHLSPLTTLTLCDLSHPVSPPLFQSTYTYKSERWIELDIATNITTPK